MSRIRRGTTAGWGFRIDKEKEGRAQAWPHKLSTERVPQLYSTKALFSFPQLALGLQEWPPLRLSTGHFHTVHGVPFMR